MAARETQAQTQTDTTACGRFFNARKQSGGITVAVDITNHLIPWAIAKRMQADAWDEGYDIGGNDVGSGWREDELTKNPYREDA